MFGSRYWQFVCHIFGSRKDFHLEVLAVCLIRLVQAFNLWVALVRQRNAGARVARVDLHRGRHRYCYCCYARVTGVRLHSDWHTSETANFLQRLLFSRWKMLASYTVQTWKAESPRQRHTGHLLFRCSKTFPYCLWWSLCTRHLRWTWSDGDVDEVSGIPATHHRFRTCKRMSVCFWTVSHITKLFT